MISIGNSSAARHSWRNTGAVFLADIQSLPNKTTKLRPSFPTCLWTSNGGVSRSRHQSLLKTGKASKVVRHIRDGLPELVGVCVDLVRRTFKGQSNFAEDNIIADIVMRLFRPSLERHVFQEIYWSIDEIIALTHHPKSNIYELAICGFANGANEFSLLHKRPYSSPLTKSVVADSI